MNRATKEPHCGMEGIGEVYAGADGLVVSWRRVLVFLGRLAASLVGMTPQQHQSSLATHTTSRHGRLEYCEFTAGISTNAVTYVHTNNTPLKACSVVCRRI